MVPIKKILCCCGGGAGSSFMVQLNILKVLKEDYGITDIEVDHCSLGEISANKFDLLVVGWDLAYNVREYPRRIELFKIMDLNELRKKLDVALHTEEDEYVLNDKE